MGAWQPLPDDLPPEVRHFVEQLRLLKDGTGLSLVSLGARTAYSKSSWQRYLNATQPPPRQAVAALCRVAGLAGADAERHTVRWEMAVKVWPKPTAAVPAQAHAQVQPQGQALVPVALPVADGPGGEVREAYEEVPTVPWWDRPEERPAVPRRGPGGRLLVYAVALLAALLVTAVVGAVALG
ncbi:helix-turn-helix domain-containing protein [Streptomyces sp. NRRL S-340]|uniref:helix-turn-helix domain-containing protein n=1 Tax=Streptomyces sp. NRRL S-340 TaxID=1463901 RepID=UPI000569FCB5|nr:helix-turn-helix transcriptional regulator [Streptomyces sp. NRRL S-340]